MGSSKFRKAIIGLIVMLGIGAPGTYLVVDTVGPSPTGEEPVLYVHALTWWPRCGLPPSHPNGYIENIQSDIAKGRNVAGYWLVAPPISFGLPNSPEGRAEAGRRSAALARENVPNDVWDKLVFAAPDVEVPGDCVPQFEIHRETIYAAVDSMREMKCLANVADPCVQVLYTSCGEWTGRVLPRNPAFPEDTLLWMAHWDGSPLFESFNRCPFGGLTVDDVVLKQYKGNTLYNSASVDLNSLEINDPTLFEDINLPLPTPTPVSTTWPRYDGQRWQFSNGTGYRPDKPYDKDLAGTVAWERLLGGEWVPEWGDCGGDGWRRNFLAERQSKIWLRNTNGNVEVWLGLNGLQTWSVMPSC